MCAADITQLARTAVDSMNWRRVIKEALSGKRVRSLEVTVV
jgi:hypothetical protein